MTEETIVTSEMTSGLCELCIVCSRCEEKSSSLPVGLPRVGWFVRYIPQSYQRSLVKPQALPDFRSEAEEMLREMAFLLHVTRSLKQAMIDERTSHGTRLSLAAVAT
jgi:hypothetical protein